MILSSMFRQVKFALQGINRNAALSFVSMTILSIAILSGLLFSASVYMTNAFFDEVEKKYTISIDMNTNQATEADIDTAETFLNSLSEVEQVRRLSEEENLEKTLEELKNSDFLDEGVLDILYFQETFQTSGFIPTTFEVVIQDSSEYPSFLEKVRSSEFADKFLNLSDTINEVEPQLRKLSNMIQTARKFLLGVIIYFLILAIIIIYNTTKLSIRSRSKEIEIMKLVGASKSFIRNPFILESIFINLFSVFLVFGLTHLFLDRFNSDITDFFRNLTEINLQEKFLNNIQLILPIALFSTLSFTMFSTLVSMKRYLKV